MHFLTAFVFCTAAQLVPLSAAPLDAVGYDTQLFEPAQSVIPTPKPPPPVFDIEAGTEELLTCYSDGVDRELSLLSIAATEFAEANDLTLKNAYKALFIAVGGYPRIGALVRADCDSGFASSHPIGDAQAVAVVSGAFFEKTLSEMDREFLRTCQETESDPLKPRLSRTCALLKTDRWENR
jgi:hypothetical protein